MEPKKMTLDEYLGLEGVSFVTSDYILDKLRIPHGLTARQEKKLHKEADAHADAYAKKRKETIAEYSDLVKKGKIIPKTNIEKMIETARFGHPDNEATKAARRMCEKRGIIWD